MAVQLLLGQTPRPWMGRHTIDTICRDAAKERIPFETKYTAGSTKTQVLLTCGQVRVSYTVDLETDVVEQIIFSTEDGRKGQLEFSYLQEIDKTIDEFVEPAEIEDNTMDLKEERNMLWFLQVAGIEDVKR